MNRKKISFYVLLMILTFSAFLAGCGRGGGGRAAPVGQVSVITGIVGDGPIKNARVFLDINNNGIYEAGEPFSITNENGEYRIEHILDSGTDYLLCVEGSSTLKTEDSKDNPEAIGTLTFAMFTKITSVGVRNGDIVSATYRQDVTPLTFKSYLKELKLDERSGIAANIKNLIQSTDTNNTSLFKTYIKGNQNQQSLTAMIPQVAGVVKTSNDARDLQSTKTDLGGGNMVMNFSDKSVADLTDALAYQDKAVVKIGDMVIAKPLEKTGIADVIMTNMATAGANQKVTLTVRPGTLTTHSVSVTKYENILEIPAFSQIRNNNYTVILGGDITARDSSGAKDNNQTVGGLTSSANGSFQDLEYLYFNGSLWSAGTPVTANMNLNTAPFLIVKKNSLIGKTVNVSGLSFLNKPVVIVKGYLATDVTKASVVLDSVALSLSSDTVNVKIPQDFIISEIVVVDEELRNITEDNKASVAMAVADSIQGTTVSTTIAKGNTRFILNQDLLSILKGGKVAQDFPGLGSYIDTKMVYRGVDMFLGLAINSTVKQIINENVNRYLDTTTVPTFYSGSGNFDGVTIDSAQKTIKVVLSETSGTAKIADIAVTWSFDKNKVARNYRKDNISGDKGGSSYSSTYTYSTGATLTNVVFQEAVNEAYVSSSGYSESLSASYEGTAIYERTGADNSINRLISAKFDQKHRESNSLIKQTNLLDGLVTMTGVDETGGKLAFNGKYSFYLPSYGVVGGTVAASDGTYAKGVVSTTYFNHNNLAAATVFFTSQSDYLDYMVDTNPSWVKGIWSGTFTDSCSANNGQLTMTVTDTTATWWGQSYDMSRNYGTGVDISGSTVRLKENASIWSNGVKVNDTRIEGNWSYNGCQGSHVLTKQ